MKRVRRIKSLAKKEHEKQMKNVGWEMSEGTGKQQHRQGGRGEG
jgi:hypothetical protein